MELHLFTQTLLRRAQERGLEKCEAYSVSSESFEALVHDGELVQYNVSQSGGLAFRALYQGRMGVASTQAMDEDAIEFLISGAMENAALIENDDEQFFAPKGGTYAPMDGYSAAVTAPTAHEKIELAKSLEIKAKEMDARIQPEYAYVFSQVDEKRLVNTLGLDLAYRDSAFGFELDVYAREGDAVAQGGRAVFSRDPAQLDADEVVRTAVTEALDGLAGKPVPTGKYPVILRRDVAAQLLSCFAGVFSADMAQKGMSLLKGREGEMIASPKVTLTDDPHHPLGAVSSPFDGEGSPTRVKNVVEMGRLTTLLHNLKTAKKQGVSTTGNASRGSYAAGVGVSPSNFYFRPGEMSLEKMAAEMGDGLLITELAGLHSGANQISGDFSLGAKGYLVEKGKIGRSVRQITVAGNFFQLLKDIAQVGADLEFFPSGACSPSLWVSELSVAGE